jgi:hypothetical protein
MTCKKNEKHSMTQYKDWFAVDRDKRASMTKSRPLGRLIKELLANSLDAGATEVAITCSPASGTRRDKDGLRAFEVVCEDIECQPTRYDVECRYGMGWIALESQLKEKSDETDSHLSRTVRAGRGGDRRSR